MAAGSEDSNPIQDEEGTATIRLDFSVSDATILTSLYISGIVLLAFMTMGLLLHRNAKDKRLHFFRASHLFWVHLAGCIFMALCGLISVYAQHPLLHSFNAFALFLLVIFFNHLGCSKYSYIRTVSLCCSAPRQSLLFRLIYFTENKYNLALSGSLVFVNIIWWMYYSLTLEDTTQDMDENNVWKQEYIFFLLIMYAMVVLHTGIASVYSKISLAVFSVLFPLFLICLGSALHYNGSEQAQQDLAYESLLVYWFVFLFALVSCISFFACSGELKLQLISISLIGGFLSIFDLLTDTVLIITWFNEEMYFYVILQVIFIGSGTIYSSVFITRFYFDKDGKEQYIGQTLTLLGLGRLWHGILAWDMDNHSYVMLLGNKMIKIWEMFLESYPSIFLQLWIVLSERDLKAESSNPVIWSLVVSVSSITFTVFRILYFDHRARHRNSGIFQDAVEQIDDEMIREKIAMAEAMGPQQQNIVATEEGGSPNVNNPDIELQVATDVPVRQPHVQQQQQQDASSPEMNIHNGSSYPASSVSVEPEPQPEPEPEPNVPEPEPEPEPEPIVFNAAMSKLQKQIAREQKIRDEIKLQQERVRDAIARKKQEREEQLAGAKVTITFMSKPLGCTLYRGDNENNAWIADVKDGNPYKAKGLCIGLYVHTINYEIVDNDAYYGILTRVRDLSAPLIIGFNPYPPLNPEDASILNLQKMGFSFVDCECAWQQINATCDTMTTKDVNFESKMLELLTQFNQVDEEVMISQYQHDLHHLASFDEIYKESNEEDGDGESDDDDESSNNSEELFLPGYYYTQRELEHNDDDDSDDDNESMYGDGNGNNNNNLAVHHKGTSFDRKTSYEMFLEDEDGIGPHGIKRPLSLEQGVNERAFARFDSEEKAEQYDQLMKQKSLSQMQEAQFHATRGANDANDEAASYRMAVPPVAAAAAAARTRGASGANNLAEIIGAVEKVEEAELIRIKFKRKPLGFDREAGRFGLNCCVREIHLKKLRKQNLCEGFFVRAINDRYVERLKFHAIESLLRNTPCPVMIVFRMTEPPLPKAMLKKLEEREKKREVRRKLLLMGDDDDADSGKDDDDDNRVRLDADQKQCEQVTIRHLKGTPLPFQIGVVNASDDVCRNAKIISIQDESLLDRGVRLGMFVHAIDGMICDFKEFELIQVTLDTVIFDKDFDITFSLYKPLDLEHPSVRMLYHHHGFNIGEVKSAFEILNRQKIDEMNDIDLNDKDFEMEMLKILFSQREIEDNFYKKINRNRLFGLDFDPGKPITILFEKRPLGFACESGDELSNGKNAKISVITNEHYHSIGLQVGMLVHKINGHNMDNLPFTQIASILRTHKLPMTITFTKSIALSNLRFVIKCTFGQRPFGFTIVASNPQTGQCPAVVDVVSNKKLMIQKITKGMVVHNVNGIDVMNNMQCDDLETMLNRLQLPIVVGFIDMQRVNNDLMAQKQKKEQKKRNKNKNKNKKKEAAQIHHQMHAPHEQQQHEDALAMNLNFKARNGIFKNENGNAMELEILRQSQVIQAHRELDINKRDASGSGYCCTQRCFHDVAGPKSMHYLVFYIFTITELYCRIYPMLLICAYTLKREESAYNVYLVGLAVFLVILTFETIAYKLILLEEYASWKTVFKQLYFATFTISFFLLSTMGLAYLERNVDFIKLMRYEFSGRAIIGFCLVGFVTMHQAITLDYDEWIFSPTVFTYYILLIICVAAHFYLKHNHHKL